MYYQYRTCAIEKRSRHRYRWAPGGDLHISMSGTVFIIHARARINPSHTSYTFHVFKSRILHVVCTLPLIAALSCIIVASR